MESREATSGEGDSKALEPRWSKRRLVDSILAVVLVGLVSFVSSVSIPLRLEGGDTVPGRLGMLSLACQDTFDLSGIAWLRAQALSGKVPYYVVISADQRKLVSTFGPGPAWIGRALTGRIEPGTHITDELLRRRARSAASICVALAASLLTLALLRWRGALLATMGGLVAASSFAGIATLGQGLWQQTATLPFLMLALAMAAWASKLPWAVIVSSGAAITAALLRPPDAWLSLSILAYATKEAYCAGAERRIFLFAGVCGIAASLPFVAYNTWYFDRIWFTAQATANARLSTEIFSFTLPHIGRAWAGLILSPGRGVIWYAPILLLPFLRPTRSTLALTVGIGGTFLIVSSFHKWWGGLGYGPRLLGLTCWVSIFVVVANWGSGSEIWRWMVRAALGVTAMAGVIGALAYDPRIWEFPSHADQHPERYWQWGGSPWVLPARASSARGSLVDAPRGPFRYCAPGTLESVALP